MARTAIGVDVGSRSAVALKGSWKGGTFHLTGFAAADNFGGDLGSGWAALRPDFKLKGARVGISGRDVNIRYTRVPEVPDWQLRNLMRFEVQEIGDQSGSDVASDFNLLPRPPEVAGEDVVLLAMGRETLLEEHIDGLTAAGGSIESFSPASIGLYNAFVRYGVVQDDTVLIANIGHETTDVVIARGSDLLFARNLSGGAGLFDEALSQRLGLSAVDAENAKIEHVDLTPGVRHSGSQGEKATRAVLAAAGQLMSLLQSSVMFCKSQVKLSGLKLDRVLLAGGGAAIEGLPEYLSAGMGVPVSRFDAFHVVDTSALAPAEIELLEGRELEAVVALGLATMGSDDEAYSLELLPEAVAKKRAFFGGTVWLIAAALLGLCILGFKVKDSAAKLEKLEGDARRISRAADRAKSTHEATEELIKENEELANRVDELYGVTGSGEQLARMMGLMDKHMPRDFWVTRIESSFEADEELGLARGEEMPVLVVSGAAREGTQSPASQFQTFLASLESALPGATFNPSFTGKSFSINVTFFAETPVPSADDDLEGA